MKKTLAVMIFGIFVASSIYAGCGGGCPFSGSGSGGAKSHRKNDTTKTNKEAQKK